MESLRSLRSDVVSNGNVLGSYYPLNNYSWHNASINNEISLGTLLHEEIHASCISGTNYQLELLMHHIYAALPAGVHVNLNTFTDFRRFHESAPKAYDILGNVKTSFYQDESIAQTAKQVASIVQHIFTQTGILTEDRRPTLLNALYKAFGDIYHGIDPTPASLALNVIKQYVDTQPPNLLRPNDFDPSRNITWQYRLFFREILSQHNIRVNNFDSTFAVFNIFSFLAQLVTSVSRDEARICISQVYLLLLHLTFEPNAHIHFSMYFANNRATLETTNKIFLSGYSKDTTATSKIKSVFDGDFANRQAAMYRSIYDYINTGFSLKHVDDFHRIPTGAFSSYLNQLVGAFPSALINLFDLFVSEQSGVLDRAHYDNLRQFVDRHSVIRIPWTRYLDCRNMIWEALGSAAPYALQDVSLHFANALDVLFQENRLGIEYNKDSLKITIGERPVAS